MKNILLLLLTCLSVALYGQVERMPNLTGTFNASQTVGDATTWTLTGPFSDASGVYDASGIQVGDIVFFSDGAYTFFLPITEIVSAMHPTLSVKVSKVGITQISSVPSGQKAIFHPTSKGYFPFVSGISNADQQAYNEYLVALLDKLSQKRDTSIAAAVDYNLGTTVGVTKLERLYRKVTINLGGIGNKRILTLPDGDANMSDLEVIVVATEDTIQVQPTANDGIDALFRKIPPGKTGIYRSLITGASYQWRGSFVDVAGSSSPTGAAGGSLTGTYPDPTLAANTVGNTQVINKSLDSTDIKNRGLQLLQLDQSGATNGQVPTYNATTGNWEPGTVSGGGGGTTNLAYVTDAATGIVSNSNGSGFTIPEATDLIAGLLSASKKLQYDAKNSGVQFKDEGTNLGAQGTVTAVDVTGAGATASRSGNTVTINVPGSGVTSLVINSNTTASPGVDLYLSDTSTGSITVTISPGAFTNRVLHVKKITNNSNNVTITPSSGTIDGSPSYTLFLYNEVVTIFSNGTNLYIL